MVDPIIRQIINRDCHVSMSYRSCVRHVISRFKNGHASFRALDRQQRRSVIAMCFVQHWENHNLYRDVMTGRLGQ